MYKLIILLFLSIPLISCGVRGPLSPPKEMIHFFNISDENTNKIINEEQKEKESLKNEDK